MAPGVLGRGFALELDEVICWMMTYGYHLAVWRQNSTVGLFWTHWGVFSHSPTTGRTVIFLTRNSIYDAAHSTETYMDGSCFRSKLKYISKVYLRNLGRRVVPKKQQQQQNQTKRKDKSVNKAKENEAVAVPAQSLPFSGRNNHIAVAPVWLGITRIAFPFLAKQRKYWNRTELLNSCCCLQSFRIREARTFLLNRRARNSRHLDEWSHVGNDFVSEPTRLVVKAEWYCIACSQVHVLRSSCSHTLVHSNRGSMHLWFITTGFLKRWW